VRVCARVSAHIRMNTRMCAGVAVLPAHPSLLRPADRQTDRQTEKGGAGRQEQLAGCR